MRRISIPGSDGCPRVLPCAAADDVDGFAAEFSPALVEAEGRTNPNLLRARATEAQSPYTSERQANGQWGPAAPVEELNSGFQDAPAERVA